MSFLDRIYKKSDSVVFRKIGEECILVPIRQGVGDLDSIYTLNETAAVIWELIDGKTSVEEIKERLLLEYDVTPSQVEEDLLEQLDQLEGIKAISQGGSDALP
jgi:hypothetical protein